MCTQLTKFFETIFSRYQSGFPEGFSTQQCLLAILEKWKRSIDKGKTLSKAFVCLDDKLLIVKLHTNAYKFRLPPLKLIQNYMSNRR